MKKSSDPELYLIGGDDRFETEAPRAMAFASEQEREARLRWLDGFYRAAVCRVCRFTIGRRSDKRLRFIGIPTEHDGAPARREASVGRSIKS